MHVDKPQRPRLGWPCNEQAPPHLFFDFSQDKHPRSLSIITGKHKSEFSPLTLLSFLLRKELGSSLKSPLSNPRVHTLKERQDSSHFLFTLSQRNQNNQETPSLSCLRVQHQKERKLSQALYLSYFWVQPLGKENPFMQERFYSYFSLKNHKLGKGSSYSHLRIYDFFKEFLVMVFVVCKIRKS